MKKNKGIINYGEINADNISVGGNINIGKGINKNESKEDISIKKNRNELKILITKGKHKEVFEQLLFYLKEENKNDELNEVILLSSSFSALNQRENLNVISYEQARIDQAKITNAIIQLIDRI